MLSIIVNVSKNNVIGSDNELVCRIKEDMKRFKELTTGKTVLMGRKTFESLPFALPNRTNVIITTDKNYNVPDTKETVVVKNNLDEAIKYYKDLDEEVFIIGGGSIYEKTINDCQNLYITYVDKEVKGDTFFPPIPQDFHIDYKSDDFFSDTQQCNFCYINYKK